MCDPLTIAGLALTAGSTVMNYMGNQQVMNARNDALRAERIRQGGLDREAKALNVHAQDKYTDFQGQEDARAAELGDYFANQTVPEPAADSGSGLPSSGSNIVVNEEAAQRLKARQFTNKTGMALGELRAFGDVLGGLGRETARDASLIGQIGDFKRGSAGVLPYELDAASHRGDTFNLLGDIAGGLGSVATGAGLSGGSLFGLGTAPKVAAGVAPIPATMSDGLRFARGARAPSLFSMYGRG